MEGAYLQIALPPSEREGRRERFQPSMCLCVCLCEAGRSELCGATMPQSNWGRRAPIDLQGRVMKIWRCIREKQHSKCEWKTSFGTRMEKQKGGWGEGVLEDTGMINQATEQDTQARTTPKTSYTLQVYTPLSSVKSCQLQTGLPLVSFITGFCVSFGRWSAETGRSADEKMHFLWMVENDFAKQVKRKLGVLACKERCISGCGGNSCFPVKKAVTSSLQKVCKTVLHLLLGARRNLLSNLLLRPRSNNDDSWREW